MELFFREFGSGQPFIILHGLFGQSDNWVTIGKRIAENFHVYIVDQRNHGQSPHAPTHTFEAMSDDLAEFIETHHLKNPIILGHSMGGKTAMAFALENPTIVDKLIVVDISPRKYGERRTHTRIITEMMHIDLDKYTTRTEVENLLMDRIPEARVRMFILKNLYFKMPKKLGWRLNLDAINNSIDALFDDIHTKGEYNNPTLFIRGGNSDYILDSDIPRIKQLFPKAQIKIIPTASHWVHADAPQEVCHLLSEFLKTECI